MINPDSRAARKALSEGTGDDAGHLIAGRFGAVGIVENLGLQNWIVNRSAGTWFQMEENWAEKLERGFGIRVVVQELTDVDQSRPIRRNVEWEEITPAGQTFSHSMIYLNTTTQKSRSTAGEKSAYGPDHIANVYYLDEYRTKGRSKQ